MKCTEAVDTPYDVLYGTTHPGAYYWFAEVLWLKTAINIFYVFGRAERLEWHVWVHALVGTSVCLMIFVQPYISVIDQRVETVALLALGGVAHIASLFTLGGTLAPEYLTLTLVLILVPIVMLIGLKVMEWSAVGRQHRASRAARGRQAVAAVDHVGTAVRQLLPRSTMGDPAPAVHDESTAQKGQRHPPAPDQPARSSYAATPGCSLPTRGISPSRTDTLEVDDEMLVNDFVATVMECETSEKRIPEPCDVNSEDPRADVTS
jgi:hypothetical protein